MKKLEVQVKENNSGFFDRVYQQVKKIPAGRVATYGQIGDMVGTRDARKVGWALHGNTDPKVPCHRVVSKEGKLAVNFAFGGGWKEQKRRLESEKVEFKDEMHVKLEKHLWDSV